MRHAVVYLPRKAQEFVVEAEPLGFFYEIVRVNRDAVPSDSCSRVMRHESKWLCRRAFYDISYVYSCLVKALRHFIYKCYVDIPECVFHYFCGFSCLYAAKLNNIRVYYASVKP